MSDRKALLVGINQFKYVPSAELRGCVNDAHDMAALLKDTRGFTDDDITILTDSVATKKTIMQVLGRLIAEAKAGNLTYLVFALSSHGTQIPDLNGDEDEELIGNVKARADEAFCPYDLKKKGDQWDPKRIIADDELHDLLVDVPESCLIEVYLDTCHSGTGVKAIELMGFPDMPRPRYLPPPTLAAFKRFHSAKGLPKPRSIVSERKEMRAVDAIARKGTILWTGCQSDQTSADAQFDGRHNGAFTYHYIKAIRENPAATRQEIHTFVQAALKKDKFDQLPQLEMDATN
ncbi:MAG: caspase family protein [Anaerolineae bacterium]|nr:caspase family protein [Anaerolineae bacterium]